MLYLKKIKVRGKRSRKGMINNCHVNENIELFLIVRNDYVKIHFRLTLTETVLAMAMSLCVAPLKQTIVSFLSLAEHIQENTHTHTQTHKCTQILTYIMSSNMTNAFVIDLHTRGQSSYGRYVTQYSVHFDTHSCKYTQGYKHIHFTHTHRERNTWIPSNTLKAAYSQMQQ